LANDWLIQLTKRYSRQVSKTGIGSLLEACACALLIKRRRNKMSKILTTLLASLIAVSAFAADAPKPATPDTKPAVEAKVEKQEAKAVKVEHKAKKEHKKAEKAAEKADAKAPAEAKPAAK
jgi:hypothetical protein